MLRTSRALASQEKPVVLSWLAQVEWQPRQRSRSTFNVLVRHLFARLLSSLTLDATDNASATWTAQVAYAAALPTLLFALYLFPAYHQPGGKPLFWTQASHHFFYVNASFALTGMATVLFSDVLFPDALDALILTNLPLALSRLLLARLIALTLLLGGILLETALPGIVFFPAVADLPITFPWHFLAHAIAVLTSGLCALFSVCALQGLLICCTPRRLTQALAPILQVAWILLFTMLLVLEPLVANLLEPWFSSPATTLKLSWFPPFWFLGLYERLLLHSVAAPSFASLARLSLLATTLVIFLALVTYPLAYIRRTRQVIEGSVQTHRAPLASPFFTHLLARTLLHDGCGRAIFCWISQTLPRTQRTRLLLASFAALVFAGPGAVLLLRLAPGTDPDHSLLLELGRLSILGAASLTVVGLRTAVRAPVAQSGAWVFRVIYGRPHAEHRLGTEAWVAGCSCAVTCITALLVHYATPAALRAGETLAGQALLGSILSLLLTDLFFLRERTTPFTELRISSVNDLSIQVVTHFVLLPILVLSLVAYEPWTLSSRGHCVVAFAAAAFAHAVFRLLQARFERESRQSTDLEDDRLLPGEIGLRN